MNIAILHGCFITTADLERERAEVAKLTFEKKRGLLARWILFPIEQLREHRLTIAIARNFRKRYRSPERA